MLLWEVRNKQLPEYIYFSVFLIIAEKIKQTIVQKCMQRQFLNQVDFILFFIGIQKEFTLENVWNDYQIIFASFEFFIDILNSIVSFV